MVDMGLGPFAEDPTTCFKRKHRWIFRIPDVSSEGVGVLLHQKAARPALSFKEIEVNHMQETIYLAGRPDWKPITMTLYDTKPLFSSDNFNPVFLWIQSYYDPEFGEFRYPADLKKDYAYLDLYDGCGESIENWTFESVWCQNVEFGELDMSSSEVITCDVTLRYDRAYRTLNRFGV